MDEDMTFPKFMRLGLAWQILPVIILYILNILPFNVLANAFSIAIVSFIWSYEISTIKGGAK